MDQPKRGVAGSLPDLGEAGAVSGSVAQVMKFLQPDDDTQADTMHDRLLRVIGTFEKSLKPTEEVGAMLTNFGQSTTVAISDIGYQNPGLIIIYGVTGTGNACTLVQHMSQVNILLIALPAKHDPPVRVGNKIGFRQPGDDEP